MSFMQAFRFPLRSLPKVLSITLGFAISIALWLILIFNVEMSAATMLWLGFFLVAAHNLFLIGYGLRIVRDVSLGHTILPKFNTVADVRRGLVVFIGGSVYVAPMLVVALLLAFLTGFVASIDPQAGELFAIGMRILFALLAVTVALGFMVGMARYAIEDNHESLFDVAANVRHAQTYRRAGIQMVLWLIVSLVVFDGLRNAAMRIYSELVFVNIEEAPEVFVIAAIVGLYILATSIGLWGQFSRWHLVGQYAQRTGLDAEKPKNDDPEQPTIV